MWHRIKLATALGTLAILAVLGVGSAVLIDRTERTASLAAAAALERSAQAVGNALNRQLLQVDGALASLPTLFSSLAQAGPVDPATATRLLRGLNFQSFAFRDLTLTAPGGRVWAATRARAAGQTPSFDVGGFFEDREAGVSALRGPVRNRVTGDWSLYIGRPIVLPHVGELLAVAEVPLPVLMGILSETGIVPGVRLTMKRRDGQLVASLPYDESRLGREPDGALDPAGLDGLAHEVSSPGPRSLVVRRPSLYDDFVIELAVTRDVALADWVRDRDRLLVAAASGAGLILASALALLAALRQRERADVERIRAGAILTNALEAMSDGFVMWDEDDRLVTCNPRYRELFALGAPAMTRGAAYADVMRRAVEAGQFPEASGRADAFVREAVAWHRAGTGSVERLLPGGRWVSMTERRTADRHTVGIRTDITAMKTALADLAAANARAQEAAREARRQNAELLERESRISFLAHHDDLTKLPNRVLFRRQMEEALGGAGAAPGRIALLYLDLDRFKDVNDTLGHPAGDALLRVVSARLRACMCAGDLVARLGGDEFAILCVAPGQPAGAEALAGRLIEALGRPFEVLGHAVASAVSVGIAVAEAGVDADTLLKQADLALYQAKASGRGTYRLFAREMSERLAERLRIEADLRLALGAQEFSLAYQPIYDLASDRLSGFEALLRWHHPERGPISPGVFVPIAEEMGLIVEIGAWVLGRACADFAAFGDGLKIAVNLSPLQLTSGDIAATVARALAETGFDPRRLELEITETALFSHDQRSLDGLERLRALGIGIVLDDFGTGYSSLSHLHRYPLDKIKIDRSFVADMSERQDSATIVAGVAQLASRLGKITTAEGVETPEQMALVRAAGCTQAQGYLLGRPQTALQAVATIARDRAAAGDALGYVGPRAARA